MHLFCFGLGYTSLTLARQLMPKGWTISGTSQTPEKMKSLKREGMRASLFSDMDTNALKDATHILLSTPPLEDTGDIVFTQYEPILLQHHKIQWLGYLSTTGVYGDHAGGWVDETTPPTPDSIRSERRLVAEQQWLSLHQSAGLPVHVFRLAGIYGPHRNVLNSILDGSSRSIDKPGQYFSRIHVEDIAGILYASITKPTPGAIFNVCDDYPCSTVEVQQYAASLLGKPSPEIIPFDKAILSIMQREFYSTNRRVCNAKVKRDLAYNLLYPSYREGLLALAKHL